MGNRLRSVFVFRQFPHVLQVLGEHKERLNQFSSLGIESTLKGNKLMLLHGPKEALEEVSNWLTRAKSAVESGKTIPDEGSYMAAKGKGRRTFRGGSSSRNSNNVSPQPALKKEGVLIPKNPNQREYLRDIEDFDLVFGLGPAGSGKTYLAVCSAAKALDTEQVSKIVITRPAVEAGEKLGFLPGTLEEKVDPYLMPIYDALEHYWGREYLALMKRIGKIEVAPLAFMRGRTLQNSFILLDEAQNCTWSQIKMLLTRIGEGSKCVVTGDVSQSDLRYGESGLSRMADALEDVEGISVFEFTSQDVVRHPLVGRIVRVLDSLDAFSSEDN